MRDEKLYNLLSITGDATRHINLDSPGYSAPQPNTLTAGAPNIRVFIFY